MNSRFLLSAFLLLALFATACSERTENGENKRVLHTSINKILATLDPALAADTVCQYMAASFHQFLTRLPFGLFTAASAKRTA